MLRNLTRCLAFSLLVGSFVYGQNQQSSTSSTEQKTQQAEQKTQQKDEPLTVTPVNPGAMPAANQGPPPPSQPYQPKINVAELEKRPKISKEDRLKLISAINAEFARSRKTFPLGYKDITLTPEGKLKPEDTRLYQMALTYGTAAKVGDRIQITNIAIRDKSIYLEINGGPKKKTHWYQHVSVGVGGSGGEVNPGSNGSQVPTGAAITLEFKDHVPDMTGPELEALLDPLFDFAVKTAQEVYLESLPPKVKDAIKKHEVLVGMNHDMVVLARDHPAQKVREKDEKGVEYEEWIYGRPPQDVTFVRFIGDEVTQVKIMKVDGERILKTEKEVDVRDGVVSLASATASSAPGATPASQEPANKPTLKRPGDDDSTNVNQPPSHPVPRNRPDSTDPTTTMPPMPPNGQPPTPQPPD
jgi:hypothetical protein